MNHKITLTQTGDNWELAMQCEFANANVATLILEDTKATTYDGKKRYVQD